MHLAVLACDSGFLSLVMMCVILERGNQLVWQPFLYEMLCKVKPGERMIRTQYRGSISQFKCKTLLYFKTTYTIVSVPGPPFFSLSLGDVIAPRALFIIHIVW